MILNLYSVILLNVYAITIEKKIYLNSPILFKKFSKLVKLKSAFKETYKKKIKNNIFSVLRKKLIFFLIIKIVQENTKIITTRFKKPLPNINKTGNISNIEKFIFSIKLISKKINLKFFL